MIAPIDFQQVDNALDPVQISQYFLSHLFLVKRVDLAMQNHSPLLMLARNVMPD